MDLWLEVYVKPTKAINTYANYCDAAQRLFRVFPDWENAEMDQLTNLTVQEAFNFMGELYAKNTLNHIRVALRGAYKTAIKNGVFLENPVIDIEIPSYASSRTVPSLSISEQKMVEEASLSDPLGHITVFLLNTGLRANELMNLKKEHYIAKHNYIVIPKSKTKAGERIVPLVPIAKEILLMKLYRGESDYMFTSTKGTPVSKTVLRKLYIRTRQKTGLDFLTNHVYRHTFAIRLVENQVDYKALAELLGHTDVAFTLNRYPRIHHEFLSQQINLLGNNR